jgi:SAM-dependent methyltransferase
MQGDVASPIDLRRMEDAREWAETAMSKRPWRIDFFDAFALLIKQQASNTGCRILELGSGPGFLAQHLLRALPMIDYVALDFSAAMHMLAFERLGSLAARVRFVERSFRDSDWHRDLGNFDVIVTHQAVHELRHKKYASTLHSQARELLTANGSYLMCDHFFGEGGMKNGQLYMSLDEQREALRQAGFTKVEQILCHGGLCLYEARRDFAKPIESTTDGTATVYEPTHWCV